jgi:hypothetical protein
VIAWVRAARPEPGLGPVTVAEVVLRSTSVGEQIAHEVRVPLVVNPRLDR